MRLKQAFYQRDTKTVALDLLGKVLHFRNNQAKTFRGRIVEVEAYLGIEDPACHTHRGRRTARTESMYLPGGHSYVYVIYGMHHCLNVVTRDEDHPEAVLIRAVEPLAPTSLSTNGPGKLCKAFGITKKQDRVPLFQRQSPLWIEDDHFLVKPSGIVKTRRIGVDYAGAAAHWPLRFFLKGHSDVSRPKTKS